MWPTEGAFNPKNIMIYLNRLPEDVRFGKPLLGRSSRTLLDNQKVIPRIDIVYITAVKIVFKFLIFYALAM